MTEGARALIFLTLCFTFHRASCQTCPGRLVGANCYVALGTSGTRTAAEDACTAEGRRLGYGPQQVSLARFASDIDRQAAQSLLDGRDGDFWVDGTEEDITSPHWRWVSVCKGCSDSSSVPVALSPQGCFFDDPSDRDLNIEVIINSMIVENCTDACKSRGFRFAGLQNGDKCYCGDTYGKHGHGSGCNEWCSGDAAHVMERCGGIGKNFIYDLQGAYGHWGFNQPNYYQGYQMCGVLDSGTGFEMADEPCSRASSSLCRVANTNCVGSPNSGRFRRINETCVMITDQELSWFAARRVCRLQQGDLLATPTKIFWEAVSGYLKTRYSKDFWIGLTGRLWLDSAGNELEHQNWAQDEPNSNSEACITMSASSKLWSDVDCAIQSPRPICMIVGSPTANTSEPTGPSTATTSTITAVTPTAVPTAVPTAAPTAVPTAVSTAVSTAVPTAVPIPTSTSTNNRTTLAGESIEIIEKSTMPAWQIILIILLIILIFLIIGLIIFCWYKKRESTRRSKIHNQYDARPEAPDPQSDSIYIDPSETGSTRDLIFNSKDFHRDDQPSHSNAATPRLSRSGPRTGSLPPSITIDDQ